MDFLFQLYARLCHTFSFTNHEDTFVLHLYIMMCISKNEFLNINFCFIDLNITYFFEVIIGIKLRSGIF